MILLATALGERMKGREEREREAGTGCWVGPGPVAGLARVAAAFSVVFLQKDCPLFFSLFSKLKIKIGRSFL